jgi:hypothetical protein
MKLLLFISAITFFAAAHSTAQVTSIYTDLDASKCKTLELDEEGAGRYRGECKGVGGYKLHVTEGDLRQSIDVVAPGGKKTQLGFWNVSSAFSSVGSKAEWRVRRGVPFALIVRFNVSEDPEDAHKITSLLVVSRIKRNGSCITDVVRPQADQNVIARRLADASASKPCMFSNEDE